MFNRIVFDAEVMGGRPSIKGTRILVSTIVSQIARGVSVGEILVDYPSLKAEDVRQAIEYAAWLTRKRPPLIREQERVRRSKREVAKPTGSSPSKPSEPKPDIAALFRDGRVIDAAIRRAARAALLDHKRTGDPIVVWRDGRVVTLRAEDIPVGD